MNFMMNETSIILWQDVVKQAENQCSVILKQELESYLISLLVRYTDKPELAKQIFATAFLNAMQAREHERKVSLQQVGDQCLLFAGLFPHAAEKRHVKISYFVDLGQAAYVNVSAKANDLYWSLAYQFVELMDVLQSVRHSHDLLPIQAYEQWSEVGSQRALKMLQQYTTATPIKPIRR
jgi:hypothetical protein